MRPLERLRSLRKNFQSGLTALEKNSLCRHWFWWVLLLPGLVFWSYLLFSLLAALILVSLVLVPLAVAIAVWLFMWKEG